MFDQLAGGTLDRQALLTADANLLVQASPPRAVADYRGSLGPLGAPMAFERLQSLKIDGQDVSTYRLMWADQWVAAIMRASILVGAWRLFKIYVARRS